GLFKGVAAEDGAVARVLRRALDPNPAARHRDVEELWAELSEAIRRDTGHTPMPPPIILPPPQYRVCTVMLVHLTNMGALLTRLEPDEVTEVVDAYLAAVTDQAGRVGAVVQRSPLDR